MSRRFGDSADPSSTGAFKAARVSDDSLDPSEQNGCRGCVVSPLALLVRLIALAGLSLTLPGALVAAGWSYQLSRRVARWRFWRLQPVEYRGGGFSIFAATRDSSPPPWIPPIFVDWQRGAAGSARFVRGFFRHFRVGVVGWLNLLVWYAPVAGLWWYCWQSEWAAAFPEDRDYSEPGAVAGLLGVALFAVIMRQLPLLQARFAYTGDWRVFYDFRVSARLTRHLPANGVWLALLYAVGTKLFFTAVEFGMTHDGWPAWLVWGGACCGTTIGWIILRLACVWYYPRALRDGIKTGSVNFDDLHKTETELIRNLAWPLPPAKPSKPTWPVRFPLAILQCILWAIVGASLGTAALVRRPPPTTWLHHPLIHAPWYANQSPWTESPEVHLAD